MFSNKNNKLIAKMFQGGQPQMGGPQMGGPQMGGPQMGGPQMGQPQMGETQIGGPQMGQPTEHHLIRPGRQVLILLPRCLDVTLRRLP